MERALNVSAWGLHALVCVTGIVLVVVTLARGGGPLALGVVVGVLFTALGAARLWMAVASAREGPR